MADQVMPCPFCGEPPCFDGDAGRWRDENRHVELSLACCAVMTETIGWPRARDMSIEARDTELRDRLTARWNARAALQSAQAAPAYAGVRAWIGNMSVQRCITKTELDRYGGDIECMTRHATAACAALANTKEANHG